MSTVAIICEYNPFHSGHKHHVDEIRRAFGDNTTIIALMSGNFTQRGEIAIADKYLRARCAVECGINLCLELPFPYSMSSAEVFARSAVHILNELGVVDYLSFGSESGDLDALSNTAKLMMSEEYQSALSKLIDESESKDIGYPKMCEIAFERVSSGKGMSVSLTPNNILALEYIKALYSTSSTIKPHTIARIGAGYNSEKIGKECHQSATAIRNGITNGSISALDYIPESAKCILSNALARGECPCNEDLLSSAVISSFRLNSPDSSDGIQDVSGGLYYRLRAKSFEVNTITNLIRLCETKKYTSARLRRAVWYSFFGVTSSEISEFPAYTQLLATDGLGRAALKSIKKKSDFPVLTKPSKLDMLDERARGQKARSDRADSVFQLTKPAVTGGNYSLTATPYVKQDDLCDTFTEH